MLGWLLRYPAARTAVQEKIRRDLLPFPLVGDSIQGTLLELLERIENRAIWQAWIAQADGLDPEQWAQTLDEALHEQAQRVLQLNMPESQAYRYVNVALECATILQLRLARRRMAQISQQAAEAADESEQLAAIDQRVQIDAYIGTISTPKRSAAFADLHTLHTI